MQQIVLEIIYFSDFFLSIKKLFIFEFVLVSELSIALRVRLMYSTFFACNFSKTWLLQIGWSSNTSCSWI